MIPDGWLDFRRLRYLFPSVSARIIRGIDRFEFFSVRRQTVLDDSPSAAICGSAAKCAAQSAASLASPMI
jgi:hypothetical protein